jgi:Flp pilus assembly protein TadB
MSKDARLLLGALLAGCVLTVVQRVVFPDARWWNLLLAAFLGVLLVLRAWQDRQQ